MENFGGGGMAALGHTGDFQEEEVWAMMKVREASKSKARSSSSSAWRFSTTNSRTSTSIPRSAGGGGGCQVHQSSAPVSIPDWSKIMKKPRSKKNLWDDACDSDAAHDGDDVGGRYSTFHDHVDDDDDGDEDDDDDMLPPHEYLARRLARTQIASFSMCEGVGRTLKGRDLSNLRDAILTKTGFLE